MSEELKDTAKDMANGGQQPENNPTGDTGINGEQPDKTTEPKTVTLDEKQLMEREQRAAKAMIKNMAERAGLDEAGVQKLLDDYKAKKDAEKTEAQREKERADKLAEELAGYKNKAAVLSAGVEPEFTDFVAFKVNKMVTDTTDFETALKKFLADNPKYAGGEKPQGAGGYKQGSAGQQLSGVEAEFLKRNPNLKI